MSFSPPGSASTSLPPHAKGLKISCDFQPHSQGPAWESALLRRDGRLHRRAVSHQQHQTGTDLHRRVEADRYLLQEHVVCAELEAPATAAASSCTMDTSCTNVLEPVFMLNAANKASPV